MIQLGFGSGTCSRVAVSAHGRRNDSQSHKQEYVNIREITGIELLLSRQQLEFAGAGGPAWLQVVAKFPLSIIIASLVGIVPGQSESRRLSQSTTSGVPLADGHLG